MNASASPSAGIHDTTTRPSVNYKVDLPVFGGPLDLLLHLIERQELDITVISLHEVTEQYLAHLEQLKEDRIEQLAEFLVIAARLVLIKSRALLPQTPIIPDSEEEEDPGEALVRQLKRYKQFKQSALWLRQREEYGLRTYLRVAPPPKLESMLDLTGITAETLIEAMQAALDRSGEREDSVSLVRPPRMTIDGQISKLRRHLEVSRSTLFTDLLSGSAGRMEVAVTLLAVLELIKRREIIARQSTMFGPIEITAASEFSVATTDG